MFGLHEVVLYSFKYDARCNFFLCLSVHELDFVCVCVSFFSSMYLCYLVTTLKLSKQGGGLTV